MSGILDNKSRIMDAVLTAEGRRQMAVGTFEVSYVTFSDYGVFYQADTTEGHVDPTERIYLEACNLPQDQITFEANDEGNLVPLRKQPVLSTPGGAGSIPDSFANSDMSNGRLFVYSYSHGRRVAASNLGQESSESSVFNNNGGFVYTDESLSIGKILLTSSFGRDKNGKVTVTVSGPPYVAYIGTSDGFNAQEFAIAVSESIDRLKGIGGPNVSCYTKNESVYLDFEKPYVNSKIYQTGTLNFKLTLEQARKGGRLLVDEVEGATFASQIRGILTSSIDNFLDLQTIGSIDRFMDDKEFTMSTNQMNFDMKDLNALKLFNGTPPLINSIDSLFSDDKLSHLENFMYLPPIVKTSDAVLPDKTNVENLKPYLLGDYPSWGDNEKKLTFSKLQKYVKSFNNAQPPVVFTQSSLAHNVIGQFFEVTGKGICKLDVIDFGPMMNSIKEPTVVTEHVFFVGKVFNDERGTTCFVNLFTLIFSRLPEEDDLQ